MLTTNRQGSTPRQQSSCDSCQQKALGIDMYRQPFRLRFPDNADMYRTMLGSILSLITVVAMLGFAGYKLQVMQARDDFRVQLRD